MASQGEEGDSCGRWTRVNRSGADCSPQAWPLPGLTSSSTELQGSVTGGGRSRRGASGRMGWREGLSGVCDRPGTCLPASTRTLHPDRQPVNWGGAKGNHRESQQLRLRARRAHTLNQWELCARACHLPPTGRAWLCAFVFGLLILFSRERQGGRRKAACNWAWGGCRLSEEV